MKPRISHAVAALLAAGGVSLAPAQDAEPAPAPEVIPPSHLGYLPHAPANLVPEPVASASRTDGPDAELARYIVDDLNTEPFMLHSKITVQPQEGGSVVLSGVTVTRDQAKRALEIAMAEAGDDKVVSTIQDSES